MRKRIVIVLLTVCVVVAVVSMIPTVERGYRAETAEIDWSTVVDDADQTLRISWMGPPVHPGAPTDTWVQRNLEARFNVEFEPLFLDWNGYRRRRPLMLAGGDVPDVNWDGDPLVVRRNIHHGFVLEVPYEVILKYAPTYVEQVNRYGPEAWLYSSFDGRNFGIPTYGANNVFPQAAAWRRDWLQNVGIERVPETLDEMYEALYRFRHNDPNRSGRKDTYGFSPSIHWSLTFVEIFSAFGILPQDFQMRGDQVVWGGVQPETREVLAMLRQWYTDELMDPDFAIGTVGAPQTQGKFQNSRTGYAMQLGNWRDLDLNNPNSLYSIMRLMNPEARVVPGKPLIGRDGIRKKRYWGGAGHIIWFGRQVAENPEIVIRVLKMLEAFASDPELFIESRIGKRETHWEWTPERGAHALPPYDRRGEDLRNLLGFPMLENCFGFFSMSSAPLHFTEPLLPEGEAVFRQRYRNPEWGFKNVLGKSDVVHSASIYLEDLRQFQMTTFIEIIRGDRPLEYFDEFVRLWHRRGGETITREANEMLEEMRRIYEIVGVPTGNRTSAREIPE